MIFFQCQPPRRFLPNVSKFLRKRRLSIVDGSHLKRFHQIPCARSSKLTYKLHPFLTQGAVRSITTESSAATKRAFIPSAEQQAIVELCRTQNVVVSARPGAGKTATAEAIVAADPNKPVVIITYSKRLQLDTARRLSAYPGSGTFTFHGLARKFFSTDVFNDALLRSLRLKGNIPAWTGDPYEIVILDELQDCTDDLFWLICAFISAVTQAAGGKTPQIVVLGDERQAIYEFRGADARYLSLSSAAMSSLSPYPWTHLALSKSFRLSHQTCAFVNNVFLGGEQYIVGSHNGPKPLYIYGDTFDVNSVSKYLLPLIRKYGPERTAILAPFAKKNKQLVQLANYLSDNGILVATPPADDVPLDDKVLQGKVAVSTYHQFKGNERDLVIVYGADAGYFEFLGRDLPDDTCPNTTFVALTRAREQLVVVHHERNGPMPFMNVEELHKTADFISLKGEESMPEPVPPGRPLQLGLLLPVSAYASDMSRHILDEVIESICAKHLQIHQVQPRLPDSLHIDAPSTVVTNSIKKHHEAVSDLNGLAVVAAYEHALLGTLTTLAVTKKSSLQHSFPLGTEAQAIWLCREACRYDAKVSGYRSRYLQMKGHPFNWLDAFLDAARTRLEAQFPRADMLQFEVKLEEEEFRMANPLGGEDQTTSVRGRADIIRYEKAPSTSLPRPTRKKKKRGKDEIDLDYVSIWEIKFVAQLSLQHAIQACVYAHLWIHKHNRPIPPRIILFNVRDGEKWEIVPRDGVASLRRVVEETLIAKYSTNDMLTTDEFLKKCAKTKAEVERSFGRKERERESRC